MGPGPALTRSWVAAVRSSAGAGAGRERHQPTVGQSIEFHEEVAAALRGGRPVVALESSVFAHGLPPAHRLPTARELDEAVRGAGAAPAVVGVVGGRLRVGLEPHEVERLATGPGVLKCSAGDLGWAIARGADAGTTVSGTVFAAARAGIAVAATGGIGGVHRGGSGDVSADLTTLAEEPVALVASGGKTILDLPRTLERLETLGVPVVGLGTDQLPAFYVRESGLRLQVRAELVEEVAALCRSRWWGLGQRGGVLVVSPVPMEHALDPAEVEAALGRALAAAEAEGTTGKALTPRLLALMAEGLGERAVEANRALLRRNAVVAAGLAAALL